MALWHYVCFGGYQERDTNEHGRGETVQCLYGDQGPLSPGNLMSKFARCSHPFLLIDINSFTSQRNRRHPQPIIPAPRMFFQHLATSLTLPYLPAAQSWFIALFTFTAVPLLPSLRYRTEQGFGHQPKHRSLAHISLRLVIFGNSMFEFDCQQVYIPVLVPCLARRRGQPMQARHRVFF